MFINSFQIDPGGLVLVGRADRELPGGSTASAIIRKSQIPVLRNR